MGLEESERRREGRRGRSRKRMYDGGKKKSIYWVRETLGSDIKYGKKEKHI